MPCTFSDLECTLWQDRSHRMARRAPSHCILRLAGASGKLIARADVRQVHSNRKV